MSPLDRTPLPPVHLIRGTTNNYYLIKGHCSTFAFLGQIWTVAFIVGALRYIALFYWWYVFEVLLHWPVSFTRGEEKYNGTFLGSKSVFILLLALT